MDGRMSAEEKIMGFITSDYSWEQVIYKVVAWEGLDPWNLDLVKLSDSFMNYMDKLKEMDFKVPAKYVIISAVLLRMKSDHLQYLGDLVEDNFSMDIVEDELESHIESGAADDLDDELPETNGMNGFTTNPITVPPKRQPRRKIVVDDLVSALRRVLRAETRRDRKLKRHREKIDVKDDNITRRISLLYHRINDILGRINKEEVEFSKLVDKWEKQEVVDTFLPLIFLDHERKIQATQEEMFKEILVRKGLGNDQDKKAGINILRRRKGAGERK
ncbi:MAG: segregation/condensation protein A [Candidatus Aenigmarchaeota archaeon]|nr:segregation/condensation protein A [Candidatus Aenigmarchaeota archaeon]